MKLNQICVSLELAKELKEAGYPQESLFYFNFRDVYGEDWEDDAMAENPDYFDEPESLSDFKKDDEKSVSAPTASELLEQLPVLISVNSTFQGNWFICSLHENCPAYGKIKHEEIIDDDGNKDWFTLRSTGADSAVNALAKMWLYLKQNNLLTK
jgi:hypothetical protein